jgi:hypothetical protein
MPRKRWLTRLSYYGVRTIGPEDPDEVDARTLVRHVLVSFAKELADLPSKTYEQLVEDFTIAIYRARAGVNAGKRNKSNKAMGRHIFMADVDRNMKRARLPVKRWQHHDEGWGESLYYRIAHALADAAGLPLPQDLKPLARWAQRIKYGKMSPAVKAAQLEELVAQGRRRLDQLAARLEAAQIARRRRLWWGDHLVDAPRSCEELAPAYLGAPF